jgi:hypothetical protein
MFYTLNKGSNPRDHFRSSQRNEGGDMANTFLNPLAVPGMWGDPLPTAHPATRGQVAPVEAAPVAATNAVAARPKAVAWVRMAPDILRAMAMAANHAGRSASEIWAEAAREWLLRKSLDADYDVLAHMPAKKRAEDGALDQMRKRLWSSIDSSLDAIRATQTVIE